VTLAPECDEDFKVIRFLSDQKIRIAAGHTDASLDQLQGAMDNGLTLFTHLGNGCPMLLPRHDNIVQRALSIKHLRLTFIADGAHIPFFALKNYLSTAGLERCCIVTDAIAPASLGPGDYTLGRWQLKIGEDMVARAPDGSHLVGAAITMPQSAQNLREKLGLSDTEVKQLTWDNPRAFMGI
jgi:N-acetylglucosamine-6-phosphate deacetylase